MSLTHATCELLQLAIGRTNGYSPRGRTRGILISMNLACDIQPLPDLRERRQAVKLSAEKLAHMANCSLSTVLGIEKGRRPSQPMADRIDAALRSVEVQHHE